MSLEQERQKELNDQLVTAVFKTRYEDPQMARMRELIDAGADINAATDDGRTMLHRAAEQGSRDTAYKLLFMGADPSVRDNDGKTPLHLAAGSSRDNELIGPLLVAGADINARDNNGETPLHSAYAFGHEQGIAELRQRGANQSIENLDGKIPNDCGPESGGVRWNVDDGQFSFDGQRWEELELGADRADGFLGAEEVSRVWGSEGRVRNELDRIGDTLNAAERDLLGAWSLAEQGYSSEEDWNAGMKAEDELDVQREEAREKHEQDYYAAQEEDRPLTKEERAAFAQELNDDFERDTAAVMADTFNPMAESSANAVQSDTEAPARRQRMRL